MKPYIAFFGTPEESVMVAQALHQADYSISVAVTKPARQVGRKQILTETALALWAKKKAIPLLTPEDDTNIYWKYANEEKLTSAVLSFKPELIVVADYTKKIPSSLIKKTKHGGLNVHPSLLPSYRGPAPLPWALFNGETKTGVSIVTLADQFDTGEIIAQKEVLIQPDDTTERLLPHLFTSGGQLLVEILPHYLKTHKPVSSYLPPGESSPPPSYFPRLSRADGYEPWEKIKAALETGDEATRLYNKWRAFHPWPGLWTYKQVQDKLNVAGKNTVRLKILSCRIRSGKLLLKQVQREGKKPQLFT